MYYVETTNAALPHRQLVPNGCKIFHVPVSHRVMDNQFLDGQVDRVLVNNTGVERRLARWQQETGINMIITVSRPWTDHYYANIFLESYHQIILNR